MENEHFIIPLHPPKQSVAESVSALRLVASRCFCFGVSHQNRSRARISSIYKLPWETRGLLRLLSPRRRRERLRMLRNHDGYTGKMFTNLLQGVPLLPLVSIGQLSHNHASPNKTRNLHRQRQPHPHPIFLKLRVSAKKIMTITRKHLYCVVAAITDAKLTSAIRVSDVITDQLYDVLPF